MMMSEERARQLKIAELEKELKETSRILVGIEAKSFRVFNRPIPYPPSAIKEFEALVEEEKALISYYGKTEGDVNQLFNQKMKRVKMEKLRKERELKELRSRLELIERSDEQTAKRHQKTIEDRFKIFRGEFDKLKNFYVSFELDIRNKIKLARQAALELIEKKKQEGLKRLEEAKQIENEARAKRDALASRKDEIAAKLKICPGEPWTHVPSDEKLKEEVRKVVATCEQCKAKAMNFTYEMGPLNTKIGELEKRLAVLIGKVERMMQVKKDQKSEALSKNWAVMASNALRISRCQGALKESIAEAKEAHTEVKTQLQKELEAANQVVPGTNWTVMQLRQEIVRLTREIAAETKKNIETLSAIEEEHKELERTSMETIQKLEEHERRQNKEIPKPNKS